jgi:hypothetical protein
MWGYWAQTIIIGVFTLIKILMIRREEYPPIRPQFRLNGYAVLFSIHYSIFHLIYAAFLIGFSKQTGGAFGHLQPPNFLGVAIVSMVFIINHLYSFLKYYILDRKQIRFYAKTIFVEPYLRIIPMHLSLIAAVYLVTLYSNAESFIIVFFLLVKTIVDIISHQFHHAREEKRTYRTKIS